MKRIHKIYVIIGQNRNGNWEIEPGNWEIEPDGIGSIIIPKTRFFRKEAEEYCNFRNKLENKKIFAFKEVKIQI